MVLGLGGLIGGIAVAAGAAGKSGQKYRKRALAVAEALQTPDFDFSRISPAELQLVAEYYPEVYDAHVPDEVKTIIESPEGRDAQLRAIEYMRDFQGGDLPVAERLAAEQAGRRAAGEYSDLQEGAMERFQRQGRVSGGDRRAAELVAGQGVGDMLGNFGVGQAGNAIQARLNAMNSLRGMGGELRGQDINVGGRNADIVNQFNRMVADDYNRAAQYAAGARERAQTRTKGEQQRISDMNEMQRYGNIRHNQGRQTRLQQQGFHNEGQRASMMMGALNLMGKGKDAEQAAKAAAIQGAGAGLDEASTSIFTA